MFGISSSKKIDELTLVFDIGSSSVGGALFVPQESGIPKIILSIREPIVTEDSINVERFLSLTLQSLEIVAGKISKAGVGAPKRIFCVLSSPWYVSQTRVINLEKNTPFVFNSKLADDLIQKEVALFEEENLAKYKHADSLVRPIELKNLKVMLNGYETPNPLNQKARRIEMIVFVSVSSEEVLKEITESISKHFHAKDIKFSSFVLSYFTVVRDLFTNQKNFLLVDIGGELTDISMSKKDMLRESVSYPLGVNFMVRGIAKGLGCTLAEARSSLSLYKDGHASSAVTGKIEPILKDLRTQWLKKFQESLANLSHDISIPASIYITTDSDLAGFFSELVKDEQFNQYTLTESKFQTTFLGTEVLHGIAAFEEGTIRDPLLIIESSYINRFCQPK